MRLRLALLVAFTALVAAPSAYACACCADKDQWFDYTAKLDAHEAGRVQFGSLAYVYPDTERIDGIKNPSPSYKLVVARTKSAWTLKLGTAGALTLALPVRAEQYAADIHDGRMGGGGGPLLYKELRIRGIARGSGDFKGGAYTLVLMGRGTGCLAAEDFTRWRLEVRGARIGYALRGNLVRPA